ncbi:hypothetical protein U1E44_05070 [Arenibacter sp. GZD96]|uniref:hypothetical protein n=1 Tax=Aurantibrevibacter litoralis TaxID=3106030 RepID=UPI002AFECFE5|nr:hypothetical protein [Arenibacter sp. GZD-96]MEA1785453.1 hypothetical protein [Arenibacter sp. GZD-96]
MEKNGIINWRNALLGGLIGTLFFDVIGYTATGIWWDIPSVLGEKTGLGMVYGVLGHYGNGLLLAVLYAGIAPSLWGPAWFRTFTFVTVETIALVWFFMFPLLGAGIGGIGLGHIIPLVSLIRHFAYGVPLFYFVHKFSK